MEDDPLVPVEVFYDPSQKACYDKYDELIPPISIDDTMLPFINFTFHPIVDMSYLDKEEKTLNCSAIENECYIANIHSCIIQHTPRINHHKFIDCMYNSFKDQSMTMTVTECLNQIDVDFDSISPCFISPDPTADIINSMLNLPVDLRELPYITVKGYPYTGEKPLDLMICDGHLVDQLTLPERCNTLIDIYGHSIVFKKLHPPRYRYAKKTRKHKGRKVRHPMLQRY